MRHLLRMLARFIVIVLLASPCFAQLGPTERFQNREVVSQEIIVRFRGVSNAAAIGQAIRAQDSDVVSTTAVGRTGAIRLRSRGRDVASLIQAYARRPDVEFAEPNYVWRAADVPNDVLFGEQWALRNTGQVIVQSGTSGADIEAAQAWDVAEGSRGIVVAMVDSGIDYNHPDLMRNIWSAPSSFTVVIGGQTIQCAAGTHGFNAITRTCDPMDDDGHGTHTAGIVGASGNSGLGISGVSRVSNMIALKFLDRTGQGTTANAIAAIEFAIEVKKRFPQTANVRVLNASWGGGAFSQALLNEINLAGQNGILFVAAAGNLNQNNDLTPEYPASYNAPNIIAVAATDNRDQRAAFSNFGAERVHLGAPGADVFSTLRGNLYGRESGTSAAAAVVSGAAALVLSVCGLDTAGAKSTILDSVDTVSSMRDVTVTGGRLNVNRAIRNCAGTQPSTFTLGVSPAAQTIAFGAGNQFSVSINALNGYTAAIDLSASSLPAGMSATFSPSTLSSGSSVMTVSVDSNVPQGTYPLMISATGPGVNRSAGVLVTVGLLSTCAMNLSIGRIDGRLESGDAASIHRPPATADFCTFTLESERAITIQMSAGFSPFLYLLSSEGATLATGTPSGNSSRLSAELAPGTYTIEATSTNAGSTGSYTLTLSNVPPTLSSMSVVSGMAGSTVDVTFRGTAFLGSPFIVKVSSCIGVNVSDVTVINSTTATARLTLSATVATCAVSVSTPGGTSSTLSFRIFPPPPTITSLSPSLGVQGQTAAITINGTNFVSPSSVTILGLATSLTLQPTMITATTITVTWNIPLNLVPDVYRFRVQTEGGQSNEAGFTVLLAPPTLTTVFPEAIGRGMARRVSFVGAGFTLPIQINAGPDITVADVVLNSFTNVSATLTVSPTAAFGDYPISITTAQGTTAPVLLGVVPPPTITSFTPGRAFLGVEFQPRGTFIDLKGTNLVCPLSVQVEGSGVTGSVQVCKGTSAALTLSVTHTAALGPRQVFLSGPNGDANPITIQIALQPAFIRAVIPPYGRQGLTTQVTIEGSDLSGATVAVSGGGVTATTLSSGPFALTASLSISADTPIGPRELTVINTKGISDPVTFVITPPTWPDLTVSAAPPPVMANGYDETYVIKVRNVGDKATSTVTTVTFTLRTNEVFVSANGSGWTCAASNLLVTCTTPEPIGVNAESTFGLTLTTATGISGRSSDVKVISSEDYNVSNDTFFTFSQLVSERMPNLRLSVTTLQAGQQGTISLFTTGPFPHDIKDPSNVVTVSFVPAIPGTPTDPAIQFETGGQTVPYVIRANALTGELQGITGPIGYQAGTTAGTLYFKLSYKPKGSQQVQTFTTAVVVTTRPPVLRSVTPEKTPVGFDTAITMFAPTREVLTLTVQFNTQASIQLSCGNLSGCSATRTAITFNVAGLFRDWYSADNGFGTLATVRVPFHLQGNLSGTVVVSMSNSLGTSNSMSFPIP